ncbi:exonuclease domain-containing protein [Paenibacillus cellulositrophicus]|jgi:DNA polymerase-3 subunit epsilon|uniref:DNA polymerase III subunit epsilon n=2 Tax=Paenibacillus TaxID=44249 RepID=A0A1R1ER54_9BACL|nr:MULTISPECIES: exonuclease domain-containing protein [Paenibacillus]MCM2996791.1 exonuclease domain-containing protein [Paenibacillus cellulositrophicus]MEC0177967.1 exonuclease domain-containing protein [Paenibacillus favisporus]OMF54324.1 DNA polymerase III subunit epsilon [Paenibacillus rhizosphaerae]RED37222.1 DNA polymerase-3 subunit epsilon [Paenibacillus sp. VMFN-D1]UYO04122.1 3'-5' exoribonuclease [Paenibacillus sp. PSB04]
MKTPERGNSGFWSLLRQGGMPSAIASVMGGSSAQQMAFIRSLMREQRRPEVLHTPLSELETVVFDLETTGFNVQQGDEILSIGALRVKGGEIKEDESFYSLVQCKRPVPSHITGLTGITQAMINEAPPLMDGLHGFMNFVGGRVLVAHASAHDKSFLNAALWKTSKVNLSHRVIDTMMIARWLEPQRASFALDDLLMAKNIPIEGRHHALEDAKMTAKLWVMYLRDISRRRQVETLGDLYAYLSHA